MSISAPSTFKRRVHGGAVHAEQPGDKSSEAFNLNHGRKADAPTSGGPRKAKR